MLNFSKNIFRPRFKKYNTFKLGKSNADKILSFKKKKWRKVKVKLSRLSHKKKKKIVFINFMINIFTLSLGLLQDF